MTTTRLAMTLALTVCLALALVSGELLVPMRSWSFSYHFRTAEYSIQCNGSIVTATSPVIEPHTGALAYPVQGLTGKRAMINTLTHQTHTANVLLSSTAHAYLYQHHPHLRESGLPVTFHPPFAVGDDRFDDLVGHSALVFDVYRAQYLESTDEEVFEPDKVLDSGMAVVNVGVPGDERFDADEDADADEEENRSLALIRNGRNTGWIIAAPRINSTHKRLRGS